MVEKKIAPRQEKKSLRKCDFRDFRSEFKCLAKTVTPTNFFDVFWCFGVVGTLLGQKNRVSIFLVMGVGV